MGNKINGKVEHTYEWQEWEMLRKDKESVIEISGKSTRQFSILISQVVVFKTSVLI